MLNPILCFIAGFLMISSSAMAQVSPGEAISLPAEQVEAELPSSHPSSYYLYAERLFKEGRKDDAVFWFYAGQLRYRFHLSASSGPGNDEDREVMNNLNETIGRTMNEYAGGSPAGMAEQIQRALNWDAATLNRFTSKEDNRTAWNDVRQGLSDLREHIVQNADLMRREREKRGLPNR